MSEFLFNGAWYEIKLDEDYYHIFILDHYEGPFADYYYEFYGGKVNSYIENIVDLEFIINNFEESVLDASGFKYIKNVNHLYLSYLAEPHALDYIKIYA